MNESMSIWSQSSQKVVQTWLDQFMNNPFVIFIGKLLIAIVVVSIMIIISKAIATSVKKKIVKNSISNDEENNIKIWNLVADIVFYALLIFTIFIWFEILWFNLGILLWWLSFWLWFAFKEILWNMLAGIFVLTTKDFSLGDIIEIEWVFNGYDYMWYVEEITIRYTIIRSFNNQKIIIPNLILTTNPVKTFTSEEYIRLETQININNNEDIEKTKEIIINTINEQKYITNKEKTSVIVDSFWESGTRLLIWYYFDPNGGRWAFDLKSEINTLIKNKLRENNIDISYPHNTITVERNDQNLLKSILFAKK